MPQYAYCCKRCQAEWEVTQRMTDPACSPCPDCGGPGVRQVLAAGVVFKGAGFYATDSRRRSGAALD